MYIVYLTIDVLFLGQKPSDVTNGRCDLRGGARLQGHIQNCQSIFVPLQSGLKLRQACTELLYSLQRAQLLITSEKERTDARACNNPLILRAT